MIDPLRLSFHVACGAEHAFSTWTGRLSLWWPADHTVSQGADVKVLFEPGVGGRIFERTPTGQEFDWGWVTVWEPPRRLAYKWHLGSEARQATDVEVTFAELPDGTTKVDVEHRGWDAFEGDGVEGGTERRRRNHAGWGGVLPLFASACEATPTGADGRR